MTRNWNVDRERSNNCTLTDFEKLSYRSQSFAQLYSQSTFTEEKCMLSKLNYFTRKEEHSVYINRFLRSYEVEKEDLSVKKARL